MFGKYKKLVVGSVMLVCVASLGWMVLLNYGTQRLKADIDKAILDLKQKGYDVSYSTLVFQGHPLSLAAIFKAPHIKGPQEGVEWEGQEMTLKVNLWNWHTVKVFFGGSQKISVPPRSWFPVDRLSLEGAEASLVFTSQGILDEVSLSIDRLNFLTHAAPQPLFLHATSWKVTQASQPLTLHFSLMTEVKGIETFIKKTLPSQSLVLTCEADMSGFEGKTFPVTLEEWRDGGGVLDVKLLTATWLPVALTAEGTLTFDKDMYPLGSFSSRIAGHQEALTRLVEADIIKKNEAAIAGFVLNLMSRVDETGISQINVPITLQDHKVSVGGIVLGKLK